MAPRALKNAAKKISNKTSSSKVSKPTSKATSHTTKTIRKVKTSPLTFHAIHGGRAVVSPSLKLPRGSAKAKAFETLVIVARNMHETSRAGGEKFRACNIAVSRSRRHGIDLDDVLKEIEYRKDPYRGGHSDALIKRLDQNLDMQIPNQTFMVDLCDAMEKMYDCHAYTDREKGRLRVVFYGIAHNTVRAQNAFIKAYNNIMQGSLAFSGVGPKNSYRLGNADTLHRIGIKRKLFLESEIKAAEEAAAETFDFDDAKDCENYQVDFDFDDPGFSGAVTEDFIKEEEPDEYAIGNKKAAAHDKRITQMGQVAFYKAKADAAAEEYLESKSIQLGRTLYKKNKIVNCIASFEIGQDHGNDLQVGDEKQLCYDLEKRDLDDKYDKSER